MKKRICAVLCMMALVLGGMPQVFSAGETSVIERLSPANGDTDVYPDTVANIVFAEPVDISQINNNTVVIEGFPNAVKEVKATTSQFSDVFSAGRQFTVVLNTLQPSTVYYLTVKDIVAKSGNKVEPKTVKFTTGNVKKNLLETNGVSANGVIKDISCNGFEDVSQDIPLHDSSWGQYMQGIAYSGMYSFLLNPPSGGFKGFWRLNFPYASGNRKYRMSVMVMNRQNSADNSAWVTLNAGYTTDLANYTDSGQQKAFEVKKADGFKRLEFEFTTDKFPAETKLGRVQLVTNSNAKLVVDNLTLEDITDEGACIRELTPYNGEKDVFVKTHVNFMTNQAVDEASVANSIYLNGSNKDVVKKVTKLDDTRFSVELNQLQSGTKYELAIRGLQPLDGGIFAERTTSFTTGAETENLLEANGLFKTSGFEGSNLDFSNTGFENPSYDKPYMGYVASVSYGDYTRDYHYSGQYAVWTKMTEDVNWSGLYRLKYRHIPGATYHFSARVRLDPLHENNDSKQFVLKENNNDKNDSLPLKEFSLRMQDGWVKVEAEYPAAETAPLGLQIIQLAAKEPDVRFFVDDVMLTASVPGSGKLEYAGGFYLDDAPITAGAISAAGRYHYDVTGIVNHSAETKSVTAIVAVYQNDTLYRVGFASSGEILPGASAKDLSAEVNLSAEELKNGGFTAKTFLWDSLSAVRPIE